MVVPVAHTSICSSMLLVRRQMVSNMAEQSLLVQAPSMFVCSANRLFLYDLCIACQTLVASMCACDDKHSKTGCHPAQTLIQPVLPSELSIAIPIILAGIRQTGYDCLFFLLRDCTVSHPSRVLCSAAEAVHGPVWMGQCSCSIGSKLDSLI